MGRFDITEPQNNTSEETCQPESSSSYEQDALVIDAFSPSIDETSAIDPHTQSTSAVLAAGEVMKGDMPPTPKAHAVATYPTKAKDSHEAQAADLKQTEKPEDSEVDSTVTQLLQETKKQHIARYRTLAKKEIDAIVEEKFILAEINDKAFQDAIKENDSIEKNEHDLFAFKKQFEDKLVPQLTSEEMEIILDALGTKSSLDHFDELADQLKKLLTDELSVRYHTGHTDLSPDKWKANKIRRISDPTIPELPDTRLRTRSVYNTVNTINALRLGALRTYRPFSTAGMISPIFVMINSVFSLLYGPRLFFDACILLKNTWGTEEERTTTPNPLNRLKRAFYKDGRNTRMANDFMWFGVNLACLIITGGLSAWLNLGLFVFDFAVDRYKYRKTLERYKNIYVKINNAIEDLKAKFKEESDDKSREEILKSISNYKSLLSRVKANEQTEANLKRYALIITTVILVGMLFVLFPPVGATLGLSLSVLATKALIYTGAALTISGSLFGSAGQAILNACAYIKNKTVSHFEESATENATEKSKSNLRKYTTSHVKNKTVSHFEESATEKSKSNLGEYTTSTSHVNKSLTATTAAPRTSSIEKPSIPTAPITNIQATLIHSKPEKLTDLRQISEERKKQNDISSAHHATTFKPAAKMSTTGSTQTAKSEQTEKTPFAAISTNDLKNQLLQFKVRRKTTTSVSLLSNQLRKNGVVSDEKRLVAPASHFNP